MTNNEPDEFDLSNEDAFPDGEECSDMEEMVFEVSDSDRVSTPRTAPVEAPFIKGQILGGRFEVLRSIRDTSVSRIVRAKDRVRGGSDIALEVANRNVLARIENLPDRIHGIVPRLKELSHKVINPLLDFGILPDGRLYFSSQVLGGRTLDSMLANNQPLTTEAAFATTRRLLRALEYGHSLGQVHGTLAPKNILFEDSGEPLE
ncbi:MAG: serine/threonine protein kinase, partial [Gammaproteobacteria bacterium]